MEFYSSERLLDDVIKDLQDVIDVQCKDGNWNHDECMFGLANGLILSLSIAKGEREPKFLEKPKVFLCDKKANEKGVFMKNLRLLMQ
jgi:hypothetical protein